MSRVQLKLARPPAPKPRIPKLTPWFSGDVKPVRAGPYEREYPMKGNLPDYSLWNGDAWCYGRTGSVSNAAAETQISPMQNLPWRGLASDPAKESSK
jgi:hypothetical protein